MENIPEDLLEYYRSLPGIYVEPTTGICCRCGAHDGEEIYGYSTVKGIFICFMCEECRNLFADRPFYLTEDK